MKSSLAALAGVLIASTAHAASGSFEVIERGKILATAGDCISCHTVPGGTPFAGGRAVETPFGNVVAPNITPDNETGIGAWSDETFIRAMQIGIGQAGEHLYPAFPYPYYALATREDLLAIRAYLATLEPVHNAVEPNQLHFPFDIRATMIVWNKLFFQNGQFQPVAGKSDEWNRGAYLVEGLGHCAACHTSKNLLGGDQKSAALQGSEVQDWFAPALTSDLRAGLGGWSVDDVVEYLRTGRNAKSAASGPMGEVIALSTSKLPESDVHAMAVYLKDLPASSTAAPSALAMTDARMQAGLAIYNDNCTSCHVGNGMGVARMFPALAGNAVVQSVNPITLARVVLQGTRAIDTDVAPTGPTMPAYGWKLNDDQVASLLSYMRNAWGNAADPVDTAFVTKIRKQLEQSGGQ